MTTNATPISLYSLHPKETYVWKQPAQCPCMIRVALRIISLVVMPFELLARLIANGAIALYTWLFPVQEPLPLPINTTLSNTLLELIRKAGENVPTQRLTKEVCLLKAQGTLYGQSVGDALGLITEFSKKAKPRRIEFSDLPTLNPHRYDMFAAGGWTDDTDQMIAIARSEVEAQRDATVPKEIRMAKHLHNWLRHGLNGFSTIQGASFISRADPKSKDELRSTITYQDVGAMTSGVIAHRNFLRDPYGAALHIWKRDNGRIQTRPAANGALMRTSILGVIYRNDLNRAVVEAIRYAKVTHADPRSIASAVALTVALALLHSGASLDSAMEHAEKIAVRVLWDEVEGIKSHLIDSEADQWQTIALGFEEELRACTRASLEKLALSINPIGYTFKCLGSAFYAAREAQRLKKAGKPDEEIFRTLLEAIIFEGGDADTNAAVVGALLGAYLGNDAIPKSWRDGLHSQDKSVLEEALGHAEMLANTDFSLLF